MVVVMVAQAAKIMPRAGVEPASLPVLHTIKTSYN